MIKPEELRIGNIVQRPEELRIKLIDGDVIYFGINCAMMRDCERLGKDWAFEGIPLTEEWLVKMGFEMYPSGVWNDHVRNFNSEDMIPFSGLGPTKLGYNLESADGMDLNIKYVHQMQNLYFALTGKELTFK